MLPFLAPIGEFDVTLHAAALQSVAGSLLHTGEASVLTGGAVTLDVRAAGPSAAALATANAEIARSFDVAAGQGAGPPSTDVNADAGGSATWNASARSSVSIEAEGSLATTYGLRATSTLLEIDPFGNANRLNAAGAVDLSYDRATSNRSSASASVGYAAEGAPAADTPAAVGLDTQEIHGDVSLSYDLGPRDAITQGVYASTAHFNHALLDTAFHRGPADIQTNTFYLSASHEVAPRMFVALRGGFSVGTPMPLLRDARVVPSPDLGLSFSYASRRARITGRYSYAYSSIGPRIGYGMRHKALVKLFVRPLDGVQYRDVSIEGVARFSHGSAPLGEDAVDPGDPLAPALPVSSRVTTTTVATGWKLEVPLLRGLSLLTRIDLQYAQGSVDHGPTLAHFMGIATLGLGGTVSTDKRRTVPRDPEAEAEEARRGWWVPPPSEQRVEDRSDTDRDRDDSAEGGK